MKMSTTTCELATRITVPLAVGGALCASSGVATGVAIGAALAVAMVFWKPKPPDQRDDCAG